MKRIIFIIFLLVAILPLVAQNRAIARGAKPGELYLTEFWYGIYQNGGPYYDTVRTAVYRLTENGKKLTIQYDVDYFADNHNTPGTVMQPMYILADATPGVLYSNRVYVKDWYDYTQLWVSFDYGKSWVFREENNGLKGYCSANVGGLIYRYGTDGLYKSLDYGCNFIETIYGSGGIEPGLKDGEAFNVWGKNPPYQDKGRLRYTCDFGENYLEILIDNHYLGGNVSGRFPDVYRGGLSGEVYIHSWFPDDNYRVSFSADTGYVFRHVYVDNEYQWKWSVFDKNQLLFMSDREEGVFYILNLLEEEDTDPFGWHLKLYVHYYTDYGETLVATYIHDITKRYGVNCEPVSDLLAQKIDDRTVMLNWSDESSLPVDGYQIFRNSELVNSELVKYNSYIDENLPNGEYEYYVVTHYVTGCVSDISNVVMLIIDDVEIEKLQITNYELRIYPNPTSGELQIKNIHRWLGQGVDELSIKRMEILDITGKTLMSFSPSGGGQGEDSLSATQTAIDISHLPNGIYFLKIQTNNEIITTKIIKI